MPKKLEIIDNSDYINRLQAFKWMSNSDLITLNLGSTDEFVAALTELIKQNVVFDRVVFRTHGDDGAIYFGNNSIHSWDWPSLATRVNFPALFPVPTKVYFDGCDVAAGETGTFFLKTAGKILLRGGGGSTQGWASLGLAIPGVIPIIGGHTIHNPEYKNLKVFYFKAGGDVIPVTSPPLNTDDIWGDRGKYQKPNIGNKF